ncbi:winged helix-turn-helix transcriptional regulator [Acidianus brierleyi]|uniref:Winged helix-turn-helix domain-containing protein n=1 Tax=Acidianus brierleyi TaxID=41673 RepID=A0A2U9IG29_9CREN|nr:winged helix-turn-helix transcriptional regulator [Acidianus brierleyi]AWR95007.1 winged helix-turn-helix transcriptional regulator [Acidianus brierleyi]
MESKISTYEDLIHQKIIERGSQGISQQELAKSVGLSTRELSTIVKRLIEKKLIIKKSIKENGKSIVKLFAIQVFNEPKILIELRNISDIPCFSCKFLYKCNNGAHVNPNSCSKLSEWILSIIR